MTGSAGTLVRLRFGSTPRLRIGEAPACNTRERAVALREVDGGARVERRQVGDQLDGCLPFPAGERGEAGEEVVIGEAAAW